MTSVALKRLAVVALLLVGGLTIPATGHAVTVSVSGQANIFGAGHATTNNVGGGMLPPGFSFAPGSGQILTFSSVTGSVSCSGPPAPFNGAEGGNCGGASTNINSDEGISGNIHTNRNLFLVGVFLDGTEPSGAGPARLPFTDPENFTTLSPAIAQTFFVGDGVTDTGGLVQQFLVPATATRLFLGFADAFSFQGDPGFYTDNPGSLTATFAISQGAPVPEPTTWILLASAVSVMGYAVRKRGRR